MIQSILIGALIILILFIVFSVIKKVIGFFFKIALFLIIIICCIFGMYYFEYHILNSSSNLTILISNEDKIITGSNFGKNKITTLNETEIKNINYINTKNNNFTIIYYQNNYDNNANNINNNNNVEINMTTIIIGGNYTLENNPLLNCDIQINSMKCIKNILAASKANDIHIIPKSRLSSIFELLHK